jgi:hypothetical protein
MDCWHAFGEDAEGGGTPWQVYLRAPSHHHAFLALRRLLYNNERLDLLKGFNGAEQLEHIPNDRDIMYSDVRVRCNGKLETP